MDSNTLLEPYEKVFLDLREEDNIKIMKGDDVSRLLESIQLRPTVFKIQQKQKQTRVVLDEI